MICNQWDIVLVPFPFMEMPASKRRPALVMSSKDFNEANDHSIFAMITTAAASTWLSDHFLADPIAAGLSKGCYVRWKTFTLPNNMIVRPLGRLAPADQSHIETQLAMIFKTDQNLTLPPPP